MADYENYNLWGHFLSSLQKSTKNFTPEKQNDIFLGSVDCFSTSLSRRLLETSGQGIETKKPKITHDGASDGAFSTTLRATEDTAAVPSNSYTSCKQYSSGTKTLDSMIKPQMTKTSTSMLPPEVFTDLNEDVETNRTRKRNVNTNKRKMDVDIPCSAWTLQMLSNYVDFKQSVGEIKLENRNGGSPDMIDRIVSRALKQIKSVQRVIFARNASTPGHRHPKTDSGNIYDLSGIRGTEADIRILLDAVLIPFAEELELTIETEKSYRNKNLPSCTFDYRLHYKHDVVGLVEAKSRLYGNGLGPESVVQGILQLSALQAEVYGRRSKTLSSKHLSSIPFFNIISDGYQFIFMQLDHDKLRFDHQPRRNVSGDDMSTLKFHIMDSQKGIGTILERLAKLLFQVIRSIDQTEENEDDETVD